MGAKIQEPNLRDHLSTPKCLTERLPILFLGGALLVARRRTILMLACPRSQSGKRESRNAQDRMNWPPPTVQLPARSSLYGIAQMHVGAAMEEASCRACPASRSG